MGGDGAPDGVLVDGWFLNTEDLDPGGLQFDTGECTRALLDAYAVLEDPELLAAARRAGRWATAQVAVGNWNYNAFSVGALARLARVEPTSADGWAAAALRHAELGVLPGALPNGRWLDPHNARINYHMILLRDLGYLTEVVESPWVDSVYVLALQRSVDELAANGSTTFDDGLEAHLQALRLGWPLDDALDGLLTGAWRDGNPQSLRLAQWVAEALGTAP